MDLSRQTVALCILGTQAEFDGRADDARDLYARAWDCAIDSYDRCIAAHYVAHLETDPQQALAWNCAALAHAQNADPAMVEPFLPSLYVNLGCSYEQTGDAVEAARYYDLAARLGLRHQMKPYCRGEDG